MEKQFMGTVECQGDATPCVLRPSLLRPFFVCGALSRFDSPVY